MMILRWWFDFYCAGVNDVDFPVRGAGFRLNAPAGSRVAGNFRWWHVAVRSCTIDVLPHESRPAHTFRAGAERS